MRQTSEYLYYRDNKHLVVAKVLHFSFLKRTFEHFTMSKVVFSLSALKCKKL